MGLIPFSKHLEQIQVFFFFLGGGVGGVGEILSCKGIVISHESLNPKGNTTHG